MATRGTSIDIAAQGDLPPRIAGTPVVQAVPPVSSGSSGIPNAQAISDIVGGVLTTGTQDGVTVTYDQGNREADFVNTDKGTVAVTAHEGESDPHPQYTTDAEAGVIADASAAAEMAAHLAAGDPHSQYTTAAELAAGISAHVADPDPHTQYVKTASLSELIDDRVAALLVAGSNVILTYNDVANTLTVASTGGGGGSVAWGAISGTLSDQLDLGVELDAREAAAESYADAAAAAAQAASESYADAGDASTLAAAQAYAEGYTDAVVPSILDYVDNAIATHEAAADPHPGYVLESALDESIDDRVNALLVPGSNITLTYDDALNTLTVASTGGGGGSSSWGSITGTLSAQTDLQAALDAKLDDSQAGAFGLALLDDTTQAAARTTLGLGTMATQPSANYALLAGATFTGTVNGTSFVGPLTGDATRASYLIRQSGSDADVPMPDPATAGAYVYQQTSAGANNPVAGGGLVAMVIPYSSTVGIQLGFSQNRAFTRQFGSGVWPVWRELSLLDATEPYTVTQTMPSVRLTSTTDASLSSTAHAFQAGSTGSTNIIIDNNEIMARNNGAAAALNLNVEGGAVTIGPGGLDIDGTGPVTGLSSGTYTPTLTGTANIASLTANGNATWMRVGNTVTVGLTVAVNPTAASVSTGFRISLPVVSNITSAQQIAGTAVRNNFAASALVGCVVGDATNNAAQVNYLQDGSAGGQTMVITFQYPII